MKWFPALGAKTSISRIFKLTFGAFHYLLLPSLRRKSITAYVAFLDLFS